MTDLIAVTEWAWPLGAVGLLGSYAAYLYVERQPAGAASTGEAGVRPQEGAQAFFRRGLVHLAWLLAVTGALLGWAVGIVPALAYLFGAASSVVAGFLGMTAAARASTRMSAAAEVGGGKVLRLGFLGGAVTGLSVAALGLLGLGVLFVAYGAGAIPGTAESPFFAEVVAAFAAGAAAVALLGRLAGGVFAKAVDVGSGVGGAGGVGSDLFGSYVAAVAAAISIAVTAPELAEHQAAAVALPLLTVMVGLLASLVGVGALRLLERSDPLSALRGTSLVSAAAFLAATFFTTRGMGITFTDAISGRTYPTHGPWVAILSGTLVGLAIGVATEFYTSASPVRRIAEAGRSGPAAGVLAGLVTGMESAVAPLVLLGAAVGVSYFFAGLYGVGLSAVGMLGTVGTTASLDAYGAVAQGAAGVGGMRRHGAGSELDAFVLDSIGRTTGARCTGFATGAATLTAVALLLAYASAVGIRAGGLDLTYPGVLLGLLLGAALLLFVSSWTLGAVSRAAEGVAEAGRSALRDAIVPAVVVIVMPVAVAYFLGAETLGGLIAGGALGGVLMAFLGSNAGGAWESARRYVEGGALGGKGSDAHRAAEVGEAVGDPFRDVVGPTLGAVVRMVGAVSLALAPWLAGLHRVIQEPATAALLRGLGAVRAFLG